MALKQLTFLTLSVLLFSCSNTKQENDTLDKGFSEDDAKELANLINAGDTANNIVEDTTILLELSYSDSIWKLVDDGNLINCNKPTIHNIESKKWSYCEQGNGLELYRVEYVKNNFVCIEKYLTKDNELIYAIEWEKRTADMKDDEATWWNCEYIVKDNVVVDHMSLGMGKTEDESFNTQDIITLWNSRKSKFTKLKK